MPAHLHYPPPSVPQIRARSGGPVRFFVAMLSHETNTFSPIRTDRAQFEAHDLRYGGGLLETYGGTGTCPGGMIDPAGANPVTLVPPPAPPASPAGRVAKEVHAAAPDRSPARP